MDHGVPPLSRNRHRRRKEQNETSRQKKKAAEFEDALDLCEVLSPVKKPQAKERIQSKVKREKRCNSAGPSEDLAPSGCFPAKRARSATVTQATHDDHTVQADGPWSATIPTTLPKKQQQQSPQEVKPDVSINSGSSTDASALQDTCLPVEREEVDVTLPLWAQQRIPETAACVARQALQGMMKPNERHKNGTAHAEPTPATTCGVHRDPDVPVVSLCQSLRSGQEQRAAAPRGTSITPRPRAADYSPRQRQTTQTSLPSSPQQQIRAGSLTWPTPSSISPKSLEADRGVVTIESDTDAPSVEDVSEVVMRLEPPTENTRPRVHGEFIETTELAHEAQQEVMQSDIAAAVAQVRQALEDSVQAPGSFKRRGNFTNTEAETLKAAIEAAFAKNGLDEEEGWRLLTDKGSDALWQMITSALPGRAGECVRRYVRRRLLPWKAGGRWTREEKRNLLQILRCSGRQWKRIALELLHRQPTTILAKATELAGQLEMRLGKKLPLDILLTAATDEDLDAVAGGRLQPALLPQHDAELLAAVRRVTGVMLPCRGVAWKAVAAQLPPGVLADRANRRYRQIVFPTIMEKHFRGPSPIVMMRQAVRYVHRMFVKQQMRDLSDLQPECVVPFWSTHDARVHIRRAAGLFCDYRVRQLHVRDKVAFLYVKLRCAETEEHDLRRLARAFVALQALNGVRLLPAGRQLLVKGRLDRREAQLAGGTIPMPLTAHPEQIASCGVPKELRHIPEAFALYKAQQDRVLQGKLEQRGQRGNKRSAPESAEANSGKKEEISSSDWISYQLLEGLGITSSDLQGESGKTLLNNEQFWNEVDKVERKVAEPEHASITQRDSVLNKLLSGGEHLKGRHPWVFE